MTITLAPVATPPGALPSSPIHEVGDTFTAGTENALSQAIPIPHDAVPGDLLVVWFVSGGGGININARNFGFWPRPLNHPVSKFGHNTGGGVGVYLELFYAIIQEGEPGGQLGITWDFGGFDASFAMVARLYHGHNTSTPIGSWGNGNNNTSDLTLVHCDFIDVPQAGCLVDECIAFNANVGVGTTVEGDTATKNQHSVGGSLPGLSMQTGLLDFAYPYRWGGNTVAFQQGSSTGVPGAGCGMSLSINPMPKPGPIRFTLSNRPGDVGTYMDVDGLRADWVYTPRAGQGPQVGWIVAREHADGTHQGFWDAGLNTWDPQQVVNYSDQASVVWADDDPEWVDDLTQWRVYGAIIEGEQYLPSDISAAVSFTARARPVVTVTAPFGNVGAVPTAAWTMANGPGTAYQVRFFNSAQYLAAGFDPGTSAPAVESGWITSAGTTWTPTGLEGGAYYRAYVQVQRDNQLSDWAYGSFYANYSTLALPDCTAVAGLDPITGCPRAEVTVTGHDVVGYSGTTFANVFRYDPVDQVMVPLRFGQDVPLPWPTQSITIYDYDMPPNQPVTYQAQVYSTKPGIFLTLDDPTYGLLDTASNPLG